MSIGPVEPISRSQFFFITAVSVIAGGIYIWPQAVLADAGLDAPWVILLSISSALAIVWLQTAWPAGLPGATALSRMRWIWGWLRWPLYFGVISLYLVLDGSLTSLFSQMLKTEFYPMTPLWAFSLTTLGLAGWLGAKSLAEFARNVQWWYPFLISALLLLAFMALGNLHQTDALRPSTIIALSPIIKGLISTMFLWVQGDLVVTMGIRVRDTSWNQIRRWAFGAIGLQGVVLILTYIVVVGSLGPTVPQMLEWPAIYVFSNLTVPTLFISKPGLVIIITWVIALILNIGSHLACLSLNIQDGLSLSNRGRIVTVWVLVLSVALITLQIPTPLVARHIVLYWVNPGVILVTGSFSLMSPLVARWWRRRQKNTVTSTS